MPPPDLNEPNDTFATATPLENGVGNWGALTTQTDKDYFYLDLPAALQTSVHFVQNVYGRDIEVAFQAQGSASVIPLDWNREVNPDGSSDMQGTAGPGRLFVILSLQGGAEPSTVAYELTVAYTGGGTGGFLDVPVGSPFYAPITYLANKGVVSGYDNGNFGPNDLVKRQQFAKMIVRAVGYAVSTADHCGFGDVEQSYAGHYVDPLDQLYPDHYVAVGALHHVIEGYPEDNTFRPYENIMLAQVTTMVVRAGRDLGLYDAPPHSYAPPFADFGPPHYDYAREGAAHGLFQGYPGPWNWFSPATRGQCAFFIWRLMAAIEAAEGP